MIGESAVADLQAKWSDQNLNELPRLISCRLHTICIWTEYMPWIWGRDGERRWIKPDECMSFGAYISSYRLRLQTSQIVKLPQFVLRRS